MMQIRQKIELRKLLAPELRQSLKILALPNLELKELIHREMLENPVLEESFTVDADMPSDAPSTENIEKFLSGAVLSRGKASGSSSAVGDASKKDNALQFITRKVSLFEVLLKQLGMFSESDEELCIGEEIIGNLDENGYLRISLQEIAVSLKIQTEKVEKVLKLIQQFEPAGVGARTIQESMLIQLRLKNENDPFLNKIIRFHLEDVAKKNFTKISRLLKIPPSLVESLVKKIASLDPKPGRNFSTEEAIRIIPDVVLECVDNEVKIITNDENIPRFLISRTYLEMIKRGDLDEQAKEFLTAKIRRAYELMRAVKRRSSTLRKVVESVVEMQKEAILNDLSSLKPLTFKDISQKIDLHETTVCRVVMNKYVQLPGRIMALKDFFPSRIHSADKNGESVSSEYIKTAIRELISQENKRYPISDSDIVKILLEKQKLKVARRTVAKYREELKILSSPYRKIR